MLKLSKRQAEMKEIRPTRSSVDRIPHFTRTGHRQVSALVLPAAAIRDRVFVAPGRKAAARGAGPFAPVPAANCSNRALRMADRHASAPPADGNASALRSHHSRAAVQSGRYLGSDRLS
jgi:hypothetical protein